MLKRREFMLASLAAALLPDAVTAAIRADKALSWTDYLDAMQQLASAYADRSHHASRYGGTGYATVAAAGYS